MTKGSTTILQSAFAGLEERNLEQLRLYANRREYPPETVIIKQGETGHTFYVVMRGRVAVIREQADGSERLLALRGPGEFFGEMSLIDNTPRLANCVAVTRVTLLEVSEEVFDRLIEESPAVAYALLTRVLDTARTIDQQAISELKSKNEALQKAYAELQDAQAELVIKERLEREIELAAAVQRSLLPEHLPQYPDYAFAAYLQPARQVGGDFYDVLHVDDEHVGLLMADVADKGMHAALFMAVTRTLFAQAGKLSLSPAHVALQVHQGVMEIASSSDLFVTAFYGVLHRPSGVLTYVRAGHDRPLLYRPGRAVQILPGGGRFLGMWPELNLPEYTAELKPGDRLLLISDGVPDATNEHGEQYGSDRLTRALKVAGHLPAADLVSRLASEVGAWSKGAPPFDDLTLLVVEVKSED